MSDWIASLQPASWRGVPFGVLTEESHFGRRIALHEYPNRDKPWPEDIGRKSRRFAVTGFLVSDSFVYGGGDVLAQREALVAAAEVEGSGTLVHPTYGRLEVSLEDLAVTGRWDAGRYFEIAFSFYESGQRQFPQANTATTDAVGAAADQAQAAVGSDFAAGLAKALPTTSSFADVAHAAGGFGAQALAAARDATTLYHLASQLQGSFGRYFAGGNRAAFGRSAAFSSATLGELVSEGVGLRGQVEAAAADLTGAIDDLGAGGVSAADLAAKATTLAASVRQAAADPADGLRLLRNLGNFGR